MGATESGLGGEGKADAEGCGGGELDFSILQACSHPTWLCMLYVFDPIGPSWVRALPLRGRADDEIHLGGTWQQGSTGWVLLNCFRGLGVVELGVSPVLAEEAQP